MTMLDGERPSVIDVDTHITEPPDVWTSRLPSAWGELIPHVERVEGMDVWVMNGVQLGKPGPTAMAGFDGVLPDAPATFDDVPPGAYDARSRLEHMDAEGIRAQVVFPNLGGFGSGRFLAAVDAEVALACIRAYNDFVTEWAQADPDRLLPVATLPFWDLDAAVAEVERMAEAGIRGINMCNQPDGFGEPPLGHRHWDRIWAATAAAELPVTFHIGGGDITAAFAEDPAEMGWTANFARASALMFADNARCLADLLFGGVCHRFPTLRFVSVESGVGWVPGVLEAFDWQWRNSGVAEEHPDYDLLPSEYFRRQVYACFWFERGAALDAIARYPDNILYETDYPHPTCQHPGPRTPAQRPSEFIADALGALDERTRALVLHDNAAEVFDL